MTSTADNLWLIIATSVFSSTVLSAGFSYVIDRRRLSRTSDEANVIAKELELAKELATTADGKALAHVLTTHAHQYIAQKVVGRAVVIPIMWVNVPVLGVLAIAFWVLGKIFGWGFSQHFSRGFR